MHKEPLQSPFNQSIKAAPSERTAQVCPAPSPDLDALCVSILDECQKLWRFLAKKKDNIPRGREWRKARNAENQPRFARVSKGPGPETQPAEWPVPPWKMPVLRSVEGMSHHLFCKMTPTEVTWFVHTDPASERQNWTLSLRVPSVWPQGALPCTEQWWHTHSGIRQDLIRNPHLLAPWLWAGYQPLHASVSSLKWGE